MQYLCHLLEFIDGLDDEMARRQVARLEVILDRLGYELRAGPGDRIDQLWVAVKAADATAPPAMPPPAPSDETAPTLEHRDDAAEQFERQFLAWLHIRIGILPDRRQDADGWTFQINRNAVRFVILARRKYGSPRVEVPWVLRVEESPPCDFIERVARHFRPASAMIRTMPSGLVRVQFKTADLVQPFIDQTPHT